MIDINPELVSGVCAFVVDEKNFDKGVLTIEEKETKRGTNKLKGMRSLPMETVEPGESNLGALQRLFKEEAGIESLANRGDLEGVKLCQFQPCEATLVHAYLFTINPVHVQISSGLAVNEVGNLGWTRFTDILRSPHNSFKFRPGVREVTLSYFSYLHNNFKFNTETHSKLRDSVPSEVFDLIDQGFSEAEALYQVGLYLPNQPRRLAFVH